MEDDKKARHESSLLNSLLSKHNKMIFKHRKLLYLSPLLIMGKTRSHRYLSAARKFQEDSTKKYF